MISHFDNPPFAPDPECKSCGTPWNMHAGMTQTCLDLQAALNSCRELRDACAELIAMNERLQAALLAVTETPKTPTLPDAR